MAGTLTISTLSDGTNSTSSTNCIQGSAKAWVNFNGAASTIRKSYNVSSVTRQATGKYTVNLTNAMPDANYSINGFIRNDQADTAEQTINLQQGSTPSTSAYQLQVTRYNSGYQDTTYVFSSIYD